MAQTTPYGGDGKTLPPSCCEKTFLRTIVYKRKLGVSKNRTIRLLGMKKLHPRSMRDLGGPLVRDIVTEEEYSVGIRPLLTSTP